MSFKSLCHLCSVLRTFSHHPRFLFNRSTANNCLSPHQPHLFMNNHRPSLYQKHLFLSDFNTQHQPEHPQHEQIFPRSDESYSLRLTHLSSRNPDNFHYPWNLQLPKQSSLRQQMTNTQKSNQKANSTPSSTVVEERIMTYSVEREIWILNGIIRPFRRSRFWSGRWASISQFGMVA